MKRKLAPYCVFVLAAIPFLPALSGGFVSWDDRVILLQNPYFRAFTWQNIKWMLWNFTTGKYQPLSWLSFALDYQLWGMNPAGYHFTAILLHATDAVLLYLVALRLLGEEENAFFNAAFGALLWAVHPLRVECVAWATDRGDPLSMMFYLSATLFYLDGKPVRCCLAYALGLCAKATGITLPLIWLVLDVYLLGRWNSKSRVRLLLEKLPLAAIALAFALIGLKGQSTTRALVGLERIGLVDRLAQACYAPAFYISKTFLPTALSPLYDLTPRLQPAPFALSAVLLVVVSGWLCLRRRQWPWACAAWSAYLLALLPVSGLVKLGMAIASDRYSYLPSIPLALLAGAALRRWPARARLPGLAALAALALLTARQTQVWRDSETFWSHAVSVDPDCYVCHQNLGEALVNIGKEREGREHLVRSKLLLAKVRQDVGIAYYESGDYERALIRFAEALDAVPSIPETENDMGLCLMRLGRTAEAALYFQKAVTTRPDFSEARANWGMALASQGIFHQARLQFEKALALDPHNAQAAAGLRLLEAQTAK